MKLIEALRNVSSKIQSEFNDSKLFSHSGDKGEFREQIISKFLKPHIPDCYGLGSGQVFSNSDTISRQIDIVIYDTIFSNYLFRDKTNCLFPCESVYGSIEIKSNLTTDELNTSIENISSLKKLERQQSDMLDITPISRLPVGNGLAYDKTKRNNYLGIIFGYDGLVGSTALANIKKNLQSDKGFLPDFIFCLNRSYMILKTKSGVIASFGGDYDDFILIDTESDTIPLLFVTINTCLNQIKLKAPDYNVYWKQIFNGLIEKTKA